jgi:tubby-related protein 1
VNGATQGATGPSATGTGSTGGNPDDLKNELSKRGWGEFYAPVNPETGGDNKSTSEKTTGGEKVSDFKVDTSDKRKFLYMVPPRSGMIQGYVLRDKGSMMAQQKFIYHLQRDGSFLLAGRKPKKGASPLISFDADDLGKESSNVTLKVKANVLGTEFTFQDFAERSSPNALCPELGAVMYEQNVIGNKGPRKMTVLLPSVDAEGRRTVFMPTKPDEGLMVEKYKKGETAGMIILQNKQPKWNDQIRAYTLEFHGRVTMASVKNFQLVDTSNPGRVLIQFGRVEENKFNLDYQHPICGVQAFALAVTSLENKLACD